MQGPWTGTSIIFEGQSLNNAPVRPNRYPDFVMRAFDPSTVRRFVVADSGESWGELDDDLPTRLLHIAARSSFSIVVMQGGQTNITFGATASGLYTVVSNHAATLRAGGVDKIIYTTIPPAEAWVSTAAEDERVAHNALALADDLYPTGPFDAVADVASTLTLGSGDYSDDPELHPSRQGAEKMAVPVIPAVAALLP